MPKSTAIQKSDLAELFKAMAMDVGKEVAAHIETMYPEAVKAASSTFLLSVRNATYNRIMTASKMDDPLKILQQLKASDKHRREVRAAYKRIRAGE